jgi:hypothetical protein
MQAGCTLAEHTHNLGFVNNVASEKVNLLPVDDVSMLLVYR